MKREDILNAVIEYPDHYLINQGKTLQQRLDSIEISEENHKKVVIESNKKMIGKAGKEIVSAFAPPISFITELLDWNEEVDKDLTDAKKVILLTEYFNKYDEIEKAIDELKNAMTDVYGNTLVNKIFQLLSNYPPDGDLMKHLVSTLKNICESKDFEKLFDKHKFNLSLIEKMSPQALSILSDFKNWPTFSFQFQGMSIGNKIENKFEEPFVKAYFNKKEINDSQKRNRAVYILYELNNEGFIECYEIQENNFVLKLSNLGSELYEYLDKNN